MASAASRCRRRASGEAARIRCAASGSVDRTARPTVRQARGRLSADSGNTLGNPRRHVGKGRRKGGPVLATTLGEVRAATALASNTTGDMRKKFAGLDPPRCAAVHAGDQGDLAPLRAGQQHHRVAKLLLEAVHRLAQALGVDAFQARGQHLDAGHVHRRTGQVGGGAAGGLGLDRFQLAPTLRMRAAIARARSTTSPRLPPSSEAASSSARPSPATWSSAAWPVSASTRRTPADTPPSLTILNRPMSPVRATWVPPHSSTESPIFTTRTRSAYFSPNS